METTTTVDFPKPIYQRLQRQSRMMQAPIAEIVVQTVRYSLPAWLEVIPPEHEKALAKLYDLSNTQLEKIAKSKLSIKKAQALALLKERGGKLPLLTSG